MITIYLHYVLLSVGSEMGGLGFLICLWLLLCWDGMLFFAFRNGRSKRYNEPNYVYRINVQQKKERKEEEDYGIIDFTTKEK